MPLITPLPSASSSGSIANTTPKKTTLITSIKKAPKSPLSQWKESKKEITKQTIKASVTLIKNKSCYHYGFTSGSVAQLYISYACLISNADQDFVLTMNAENGGWNIDRRSGLIWANWYYDYGLCQINKWYHPEIVNDKRFYTDYKRHIEQCRNLYKWGTRFYGFDVRYKRAKGLVLIGDKKF